MHVLYQEQTCSTLKQLSSFKGIIPFCWSTFQIYWDSIYNEYFALLIGSATLKSHDQRCYLSFLLNTAKTTPEATLRTRIISTKVAELPLAMNPLCQTRKFRLWNKNLLLCLEKMWLRNITSMLGHANTYMVYTSRLDQLYESVCTKLNTWNGLQQIQNWDRKTYPKMLVREVFKWKNGNSLVIDQIWGPRRLYD